MKKFDFIPNDIIYVEQNLDLRARSRDELIWCEYIKKADCCRALNNQLFFIVYNLFISFFVLPIDT